MKKIPVFLFGFALVFGVQALLAGAAVTGLTFTTESQQIDPGAISGPITVTSGEAVGETADLFLVSSSPTGEFSSSASNWQTVTQLTWNSNWANRTFYYRDATVGTPTLTVTLTTRGSGASWIASQAMTIGVGGGPPSGDSDDGDGEDGEGTVSGGDASAHSRPGDLSEPLPVQTKLTVDPGRRRLVAVGTPIYFKARVTGAAVPASDAPRLRLEWSFGDGGAARGLEVAYVYNFPGTYQVVVNVFQGDDEAVGRTVVEVVEPQIKIGEVGLLPRPHLELINESGKELNLGYWQLRAGTDVWRLPPDTIVAPRSRVVLPLDRPSLSLTGVTAVAVLYPDGRTADLKELAPPAAIPVVRPEILDELLSEARNLAALTAALAARERLQSDGAANSVVPTVPSSPATETVVGPGSVKKAAVVGTAPVEESFANDSPPVEVTVIEPARETGFFQRLWRSVTDLF